jgi:hypothetical protein
MGSMSAMSGSTGVSFLVPLLVGITVITFVVTLVISLSPTEDEIHEDARLRDMLATELSAVKPAGQRPPQPATPLLPTRHPSPDAFTPRDRIPRGPDRWGPQD